MNADLSIFNLILEASFAVQFVMLVLLVASIASWAIIFSKRKELDKATKIADEFEGLFWSGMDLSDLYRNLTSHGVEAEGIENVFIAGYREFSRLQQKSDSNGAIAVENAQRAMRIELSRELELLDARLSFLATVGSTSPYVGLFGTVWGIMNSFRSLGNAQQATLAQKNRK